MHYIASSVPFKYEQIDNAVYPAEGDTNFLKYDYDDDPDDFLTDCCRLNYPRAPSRDPDEYFNPYGLREDYDPLKDKVETHCGTLSFFAKGDDKIKIRLAQHTNLPPAFDMNPDCVNNAAFRWNSQPDNPCDTDEGQMPCPRKDMLDSHEPLGVNKAIYTNTHGTFLVDSFLRPVPGDLKHITQKVGSASVDNVEKTIKYFSKIY
jgi:hypothetical protein